MPEQPTAEQSTAEHPGPDAPAGGQPAAAEAPILRSLPDLADRIEFLFPGFDGELDQLDDENFRLQLITVEHPPESGSEPGSGGNVKAESAWRAHTSMHLIIANQVLGDTPPQVWPTLQRITAKGYTRHDAIHMVATGMSKLVAEAMQGRPQRPEIYLQYLAGLPGLAVRHRPQPTSRTGGPAVGKTPGKKRR